MSNALRENIEREKAALQTFADELDAKTGGPTAEDSIQLVQRASALKSMVDALKASKEAATALSDTTSYLKDLSDAPAAAVKSADEVVDRFENGFRADPQGKTIGEMFAESAQFKGITSKFGGEIPQGARFRSDPYHVESLKALVTGGSATSAGAAVRNDWYSPMTDLVGERPLRVADLVTRGQTTSDVIEYVRVTGKTNNAGMFAETTNVTSSAIKPESGLALEVVSTNVRTIAHWIPITRRAMNDAPQVRTLVDNFLRYGLEVKLEDQIVAGAGTGENFTGILNTAGIQTVDATTGGGGSGVDAIVSAIAKIRWTGYREPTAVVMHPNDWYSTSFLLKKDSQQRYLIGDPRASLDQLNSLWGLRVVVSPSVTENTALVGDFRQAILWERSGINLYVSDSHADFFVRNVFVILAEMEAAFGILDPEAFCTVTNV